MICSLRSQLTVHVGRSVQSGGLGGGNIPGSQGGNLHRGRGDWLHLTSTLTSLGGPSLALDKDRPHVGLTVNLDLVSLTAASSLKDAPYELVHLQTLQEGGFAAMEESL